VIGPMGKSENTLGAEIMDPLMDVRDSVEYIKMENLASNKLPHHSRFLLNSVISTQFHFSTLLKAPFS
jgi:hypothetical protein